MMMKDAERAVFTGGSVTWKKSQDSISLDSKALLKQHLNTYSSSRKLKWVHGVFRFTRMVDNSFFIHNVKVKNKESMTSSIKVIHLKAWF
jgi:hypothetical protein